VTSTNPGFTNYSADEAVDRAESFGSWDTNMCMNFVWYQLSYAHTYGIPDANAGWSMAKKKHTGSDKGSPPAGAPVYWGTSHPYGHVALSVGGGKVRSTDWPSKGKVGTVSISEMTSAWGMTLKGWAEDLYGDKIEGLLDTDEGEDDLPTVKEVWNTDNIIPSPGSDPDNPYWAPSSYVQHTYDNAKETNDRVMGVTRDRYYTLDANGYAKEVKKGTAGAQVAKVMDALDGNFIQQNIDRCESALTAKIEALEAKVDALIDALNPAGH
jgi:hypothetical protein